MNWEEELSKYEKLGCLHEIFEQQVDLTPNAIAVVDDDNRTMTFSELNQACNVLADNLVLKGVVTDSPVGIYMERCIEYVISYIAILKAGGAYMPLDVSYPLALLEDIFEDAKPTCIVASGEMKHKLKDNTKSHVIYLDSDWQARIKSENSKVDDINRPKVSLDNLACIVYSSGTTGKPKGIMNPHRSPVFSYTWRHLTCPFEPGDRVACNVFFVWEMFRPLMKGIPLYVIPDSVIYDPLLLGKFIKRHSITRILFTPSLLETVIDAHDINATDFESLKIIWFCGEVVTTSLLDRCVKHLPWVKFYNLYSISECHDVAVSDLNEYLEIEAKNNLKRPKFAPVGKVCPGIHVVILDEEFNPQPIGMPGEIFVGGPTLSRGYLNRPEINAKRFIKTPSTVNATVGSRLYRTGDWGLIKSDRNLEICGRCDSMVKIRGYSIEIQAVEAALVGLDVVNTCVVLATGEEGQDKQLVAYVVLEKDATKKFIKQQLKKKLPFYMIPAYFIFMKSLPVVPASGKLDKKALPSIHTKRQSDAGLLTSSEGLADEERTVPVTDTEKFLEKTWCEVLQLEFIDIQESFFDLGGHSLLAARLLGKIRQSFNKNITMQALFANPTIIDLAKWLDNDDTDSSYNTQAHKLEEEVKVHGTGVVNLDMQLRAFWRSHGLGYTSRRARVLLTGATGFLGAHILRELLLQTKVKIYCLVRRSPDKSAEQRLRESLEFFNILKQSSNSEKDLLKAYKKKVYPMTGDVALFELGLSEEDYAFLSYEVDYVIHAAAYVNLVYPYEALKGANVTGTHNVLMFARAGKIKPLHYVSTNAVFPNHQVLCKEVSTLSQNTDLLENGYAQSKWVAEQLVMNAIDQGLPGTVYRMGNLSGSIQSGGWNPTDFILLVLRASLMTSLWPDVDWVIEMTPVDFASKCIVMFSQELQSSVGKIFHIIQANEINGRWLYDWLNREFGYNLKLVSMNEWCDGVKQLPDSTSDVPNGHPDVRKMLESVTSTKDASLFSYNTTFDQTNLQNAIKAFGFTYPELDGKLIRMYIHDLLAQKVIPPPLQSTKSSALEGRVAIVTGASSGIGKAVAIHLANAGAKVCIAARSIDKLTELKGEIDKNGGTVTVCQCDVTKREQVKNLINHAEKLWGSVDVLVNNAGVMYYTHMSNVKMDGWDQMIDVNCKGVTNGIGAVLPGMIKQNRGHIVNISSDAGVVGFPGLAVYSGTKFFVEGLSQALRQEVVNQGIKVTCIEPGDVKTNLTSVVIDKDAAEKYDGSATMKVLDPDDIAKAVLYAVSQPDHVAINRLLIEPRLAPI